MALADRRPLGITPASAEILSLPSFNPKTLIGRAYGVESNPSGRASASDNDEDNDDNDDNNDEDIDDDMDENDDIDFNGDLGNPSDEDDIDPSSRSVSPDMAAENDAALLTSQLLYLKKLELRSGTPPNLGGKRKKPKNTSRAPIATGILTTIPVTGEKPRPEQRGDPSLEDDVLYAIFVILYERDPSGAGMTVKQICDILVEQHPEMANLSTKTSNLVSAKLNAYVKRVEKGDHSLQYALSRDWADALPKRMVYVYRGLLAEDFHVHAKKLMDMQKREQMSLVQKQKLEARLALVLGPLTSTSALPKSGLRVKAKYVDNDDPFEAGKQASFSKGRRLTMFDLGITKHTFFESDKLNLFVPYLSAPVTAAFGGRPKPQLDTDADKSDDDDDDDAVFVDDDDAEDIEFLRKNGKRSKSMSYLLMSKKTKVLTAAAAAPRASRAPSSHSANAAAAAAALHAAALKAILNPGTCPNLPKSRMNRKWLNVIRSGFLSQDIGAPEDTSLLDLDNFFK